MTRTNLFYAIGKNETELFAYDEYDSRGSGIYFTDDALMYERWNILDQAEAEAEKTGLKVYLVEITEKDGGHTVTVELQWEKGEEKP
jgi:hypothetical protein